MCPAVLHTASEATNLGIPGNEFCLVCMPSFRLDGRLAGSGRELPAKVSKRVAKIPGRGGDLGGPGQPGVYFTGSRQPQGPTPLAWGLAKKVLGHLGHLMS
eukprot:1095188-Pelagomonas_calceolata.AAC.8